LARQERIRLAKLKKLRKSKKVKKRRTVKKIITAKQEKQLADQERKKYLKLIAAKRAE